MVEKAKEEWERKSIYTWDGHYNAQKILVQLWKNKDSEEGGD